MDRRMGRWTELLVVTCCILAVFHRTAAQGTSPPKITRQSPSQLVVIPRMEAEIECEATGVPTPTYEWKKDGKEIVINADTYLNGGNLVVKRPSEQTNGLYVCVARNQYGTAISNRINFAVAYFGNFKETDPVTFTFNEGQAASIPCNALPSLPVATVFWTDDANPGNRIVLDNRVSVDPKHNLRFSNIKLSDTGRYQCNVKNDLMRIQILSPVKEIVVRAVENIPTRTASLVYKPDSNVIAFRNKKLRLKCMAEGYPTPTIAWEKKDESLPRNRTSYESYNQELVISDVVKADAGVYECTASNGGVPTVSTSTIIVKSEPYWINKPEDVNLVINEGGELLCEAAGIPVPSIFWLINGVPSADAEPNPHITIEENIGSGRVEYVNAQTEDSAVFQCVAKNEYGEIAASGFVNVESIPAELTDVPPGKTITIEGKGFQLSCSGQGSPKPVVTWLFKGTEITSDGTKFIIENSGNRATTTSTLTVSGVTLEDDGRYSCSMSNGFGAVEGPSDVTVRKGTKILSGGDEVVVEKGANTIIPCEVDHDSSLDVTVTWRRDVGEGFQDLDLSSSGTRFRFASQVSFDLRISQVVVGDTGAYECKAATTEDEASLSTQLLVQTVPDPPTKPIVTQRSDVSDKMVALSWEKGNDGNSPITEYIVSYETDWEDLGWVEEATVAAVSSQTSLDLSPGVNYRFRVVAVNGIGQSQPGPTSDSYQTSPEAPTEAPAEVQLEATEPGKMRVSWPEVHPYNQNGPGFKYMVQWREKGTGEWKTQPITDYRTTSFEIDGGDIYKELEVKVYYENDEGPGPETAQSGFTGEGTPTEAPENVKVVAEDSTQVLITWDEVPESSVNGRLQSFLVYFERQDALAQGQKPSVCQPNTDCRVSGLSPFQTYGFQVAVKNGQRIGPKSTMVTLTMPEGPSGEVYDLTLDVLSDRLKVQWGPPTFPNGVITGYNVSYRSFDGNNLGPETVVPIRDPKTTTYIVDPVEPETNYRVKVFAINGAGKGAENEAEKKTRAAGAPVKPILVDSQISAGKDHINVTFVQPEEGPTANTFYIQFKESGDEEAVFEDTTPVNILEKDKIMVSGLKSGTEYTLQIVASNDDGETKGSEEQAKTTGTGQQVAAPIYVQGWFIVLLIIIVALLCILLVLCILKSQRGGKYNVSDKEQQRKGDIESTPLKDDDGFVEFAPHKDSPDGELPRGSQGSLQDSEPGSSDTDSLKEYADGELGKFNEEGSFIGQYGDKKQRPTDDTDQGGAAYSTFV